MARVWAPIASPTPAATPTPASASTQSTPNPTPTATPAPTASPTPTPPAKQNAPIPSNLLYYLVAFLVGYREETFRELIKRLVDIILAPGTVKANAPTIQRANPAQAPHATPTQVIVTGSGFTGTQSVKFGSSAAQFTVNGDGQLTATTPALPASGAVLLTVITKDGSAHIDFTFS